MSASDYVDANPSGGGYSLSKWEDLLLKLVDIPSVTGEEQRAAEALESAVKSAFPDAQVWRQFVSEGRWNVIMERGAPFLTLTTHLDVVPGGPAASCTRERIIGRGSCDAKGQIVAQLWGLDLARAQGIVDYRCAFVVGEETDALGARTLLELAPTPYILNGEPTGCRFASRSWASTDVTISTQGISAHSSLGTADSAIHKLVFELSNLLAHQPEGLSCNVGVISGGVASNVQAPYASCDVCVRIRDTGDTLVRYLEGNLRDAQYSLKSPARSGIELYTPASAHDDSVEVRFASDCSVYVERYPHVMLFGPGSIEQAHTDDEYIERKELLRGAEEICRLICSLHRNLRG